SACAYARENPWQADEMSVATVGRKYPLALVKSGLASHLPHSGGANWTKLRAAFRVFKTNAAGFCVEPGPGQCKDFAATASGQEQRADGSYPGAALASSRCLAHCFAESGEFVEGKEAPSLVVGKTADAARWVIGNHAVPFAKLQDCAKHSASAGCDPPAPGRVAPPPFLSTRPGSLARRHICLKTLNVTLRKRCDRAPADEWLDVAFNPTAIHRQRGGLNPPLGVRQVYVTQF